MTDFNKQQFLDFDRLQKYDALIKELIKKTNGDVETVIEAAVKRIAKLENIVGDGQLTELGKDIKDLTMAILGESTRAQQVEAALSNKMTSLFEWGSLGKEE